MLVNRKSLQLLALTLAFLIVSPAWSTTRDHLISPADLHNSLVTASEARQSNQAAVDRFLSSETVGKVLDSYKVDSDQMRTAVSFLDDEELSNLAAKARQAEGDIAGGELTQGQVSLIILAVTAYAFMTVLVLAFK